MRLLVVDGDVRVAPLLAVDDSSDVDVDVRRVHGRGGRRFGRHAIANVRRAGLGRRPDGD